MRRRKVVIYNRRRMMDVFNEASGKQKGLLPEDQKTGAKPRRTAGCQHIYRHLYEFRDGAYTGVSPWIIDHSWYKCEPADMLRHIHNL